MKNILLLLSSVLTLSAYAQLTPEQSLHLKPQIVEVPQKYKTAMPGNYTVNLPDGYKARIYYAGNLNKPRFLSINKNGVVHVADYNAGKIYALPDLDSNGVADTLITVASGFTGNHDVKFYNGDMYVTENLRVWKLTDANNDGIYEQRVVFIDNIAQNAPQPTGGHTTRTIVFDSLNQKVYLSIGSRCNVCREEYRACIEQYDINGTGRRIFANGTRNAVGLAMHPVTNRLWANNNGSDNQGDDTPPEWIDIVRDGGFYGYPFAYGDKEWFDFNADAEYQALLPITATDSARVDKMIAPAAQIKAHSAPLGITFLNASFPAYLRNGMINALHGSWNAPGRHRGYKLVYVDLADAQDTTANYVADFCTGFITDTVNRVYWARPAGVAVNTRGEIYMSSDEATRFILQIYPENPVGLNEESLLNMTKIYPNPAQGYVIVKLEGNPFTVTLYDMKGVKMNPGISNTNAGEVQIDTRGLAAGIYQCVIEQDGARASKKLVISK
jgi:glucose/arabinose dehydrogenase